MTLVSIYNDIKHSENASTHSFYLIKVMDVIKRRLKIGLMERLNTIVSILCLSQQQHTRCARRKNRKLSVVISQSPILYPFTPFA